MRKKTVIILFVLFALLVCLVFQMFGQAAVFANQLEVNSFLRGYATYKAVSSAEEMVRCQVLVSAITANLLSHEGEVKAAYIAPANTNHLLDCHLLLNNAKGQQTIICLRTADSSVSRAITDYLAGFSNSLPNLDVTPLQYNTNIYGYLFMR